MKTILQQIAAKSRKEDIAKDPESLVNSKFRSSKSQNLSYWYEGRSYVSGGHLDYWKK